MDPRVELYHMAKKVAMSTQTDQVIYRSGNSYGFQDANLPLPSGSIKQEVVSGQFDLLGLEGKTL